MPRLTATEVSRNFSRVLSRVMAGEEIEVVRNGAPVAVIRPARARFISAERFRELMHSAPPVDEKFAEDVRRARDEIGPPEDPWASS